MNYGNDFESGGIVAVELYAKKDDTQEKKEAFRALKEAVRNMNPETEDKLGTRDGISGRWEQYSLEYEYYATFEVTKHGGQYAMRMVARSTKINLIHPRRLFDVTFDGNIWCFCSDWGEHGMAKFELHKVNNNRYEGGWHWGRRRGSKTIWLREGTGSADIAGD